MSAAAELAEAPRPDLTPTGIPVRDGRLTLGRLRELLARDETLEVVAGFATACWIGPPGAGAPDVGRLTYRSRTGIDQRGRVMLDYRVRARLSVADAVLGQVADRSPASVRRYGCALRSFLRYC